MTIYKRTIWCDGCGVEILGAPIIRGSSHYCCDDCVLGYICLCGERIEFEDEISEIPQDGFGVMLSV